jgi:hypothetical protein
MGTSLLDDTDSIGLVVTVVVRAAFFAAAARSWHKRRLGSP